jgi:glycosyltransferase involved in cell wall biosynthesis
MKLCYIAQDIDGVTGLGRITLAYAEAMVAAGHDVTLVCQRSTAQGLRTLSVPGFPRLKSIDKALFRFAEPSRTRSAAGSIVHAMGIGASADVVSAQSCHRSGVAFRNELPGGRLKRRNFGVYDALSLQDERRLMTSSRTRVVLAVSGLVRSQLIRWYGVPEEKIVILPNGIDTARYEAPFDSADARTKYGIRPGELVLGFLGNEFDRKGVQTIIEALPLLREIPVGVYVAGADDPAPFQQLAGDLGVADRVHFIGRVQEPELFLRSLDMFVFPVVYEPFGMVITEAMAAGIPVITSRTAGAVEGLRAGEEILLLDDPHSAAELAGQIQRVVADDALRARLSAGARRASEQFAWPSIIGRLETVYHRVLGSDPSTVARGNQ